MAASDSTVLITGESGTGKEVVARAIHAASPRRYNPMVVVNCGALPEGILESELFGHEAGAFTGARARHKGKFESAEGGTVFLDEIGEVSPKVQVELLRVLEEKVVTRLGGTTPVPVDFRIDHGHEPRPAGGGRRTARFREDLYWRLNVVHIHIPPLRERPEDVPVLAEHFLAKFAQSMSRRPMRFSPEALDALAAYPWPGNVRELQNAIERAVVVGRGDVVRAEDLPLRVTQAPGRRAGARLARRGRARARPVRARRERLEHHAAARVLDVDRVTLYNKIKKYELKKPESGAEAPVAGEAARLAEAVDLLPVGSPAPGHARGARRPPEPPRRARLPRAARARSCRCGASPTATSSTRARCSRRSRRARTADAPPARRRDAARTSRSRVFTFVFGLARQGGRACVVSLARTDPSFYGLPPDPDLRDERAVAEILHEIGPPRDARALPGPRLPDELRRQHRAGRHARVAVLPGLRGAAAPLAARPDPVPDRVSRPREPGRRRAGHAACPEGPQARRPAPGT